MIPVERQILNGRTFAQTWQPQAIEHHSVSRMRRWERVAGFLLAVVIGSGLAAVLAAWAEQQGGMP